MLRSIYLIAVPHFPGNTVYICQTIVGDKGLRDHRRIGIEWDTSASGLCWECSGYGDETDVSLDCGRFYGSFIRPQMRMSEGVNEWMKKLFFFLFSEMWSPRWNVIDRGKPKNSEKNCPSATLIVLIYLYKYYKEITEAVLVASKEVDLEVNTYRHQTTGQNHYIQVPNESF
jgi:hypothetical protein